MPGLSIVGEDGDARGQIDSTDLLKRVLVAPGPNPADAGIPAIVASLG